MIKIGYIIAEVDSEGNLIFPRKIKDNLKLSEGDKVALTIKKIVSRKNLSKSSENPLYELIK